MQSMSETKQQDQQSFTRPALKPFVRPLAAESPALRPMAPVFGRVTLPPFGPIRYGGPKPGATVIAPRREDDEAPTWASIEEYAHTTPATPEMPEEEQEEVVAEAVVAEPEPVVAEAAIEDDTGLYDDEPPPAPPLEEAAPAWLDAAPAEPVAERPAEPMPWEPVPEPEPGPMTRRPALPLTGPYDPTPIMNQTIERTTEPHRMTPMRVTPLRPSMAISPVPTESNARAVAAALEMIAGRVRRGELVVSGSMPANDDPPALAAVLAQTLAALLGVRS
jgi:hypothetical protein